MTSAELQELSDMLGWRAEQRFLARQEQAERKALALLERQMQRGEPVSATSGRGKLALPLASRRAMWWAVGFGAVLVIALTAAIVSSH